MEGSGAAQLICELFSALANNEAIHISFPRARQQHGKSTWELGMQVEGPEWNEGFDVWL